ncbi:hypothetical protein, conserved [Plasmodium vivax]|uniref:Uncharacterized protein n=5 Tax=Plasmodium vivax TaxID=5855 RepID=A0A0J9VSE4_PLAVI|nr:hypothetical protein PVIIG_00449 [Plasmodium vivax India VII]KMZ84819.1 hypothetical protein PVBG_04235 [Plasmodium vivax Brazil I]KMZ90373.1 hypothetical protein PVMG_03223 [Plasmodium vivax Mauritania I]KMZ96991.1 hypothetical protein PVNG_00019 [Plasmodium vivax North Korean]CAI7723176.1 hypothetical protein, conserved [Plasmodium vivax]
MDQVRELFESPRFDFLRSLIPRRATCGCTSFSKANSVSLTLTICLAVFSMLLANSYFESRYLKPKDILEEERLQRGKTDEEIEKIKAMNEAEMTHAVWM